MEYGEEEEEDQGPIPPAPINAKKTPRDDVSGTTTLLPNGALRVEQYEDNAYSTRYINGTGEEQQLRPSDIFKPTPDGNEPPESRGGFKKATPAKASIHQLNHSVLSEAKRNNDSIVTSNRMAGVTSFNQ